MAVNRNVVDPDDSKKKSNGDSGKGDQDRYKTYDNDDTVNEDMKAGQPTGEAENEEGHWTDDDDEEDEKPFIP